MKEGDGTAPDSSTASDGEVMEAEMYAPPSPIPLPSRAVMDPPPRLPDPVRFRVVVQKRGLLFGVLLDLAVEVLLQQFGIAAFDTWGLARGIAIGCVIGILMPTVGRTVGMLVANRDLGRLRAEMAEATP